MGLIKQYIKRYWHDVPFTLLAFRAVWIASAAWGLATILYFLLIVVPVEIRYFKEMKIKKEFNIKNRIA